MGYIYKITNIINGKMYIGKTEYEPPEKRWYEHKNDYKKERMEKRPLYDAMNKYGVENFTFEIIEKTEDTAEREQYYIEKYNTYVGYENSNGYNATLGGDGKKYLNLNEDEIVKEYDDIGIISRIAEKNGVDNATIRNILKKHGIHTLSSKDAIDFKYFMEYGGVAKIDPDTNKIIDIYKSVADVNREKQNYKTGTISSALSGNHKAYGYIWYRMIDLPDNVIH